MDLVEGYDGLVIQHHAAVPQLEAYQRLKSMGIKQLALRITGYEIVNLGAATNNWLIVTNVPVYSPRSVSKLVQAHVMRLVRHQGKTSARELHDDYSWTGLQAHARSIT